MTDKQPQVSEVCSLVDVRTMHSAMNEAGYVCTPRFAAKVVTSINTKPTAGAFLYGMAGTGKSYLPMILAEILDRPLFVHQCTQGTREEDLLVKLMPSEDTKSGVSVGKGKLFRAALESHNQPVMLLLDEWDKTRPTADGFFLHFLQYGELSVNGVEGGNIKANLDNMTVFITANEEREFSDALLRRFPMIRFNPLPAEDVARALNNTHPRHEYMPQMIDLYLRSVAAELPKPATIQELRQLMDAITLLGDGADWNELVEQYVTKTPENHELLSRQSKVEDVDVRELSRISADDYGVEDIDMEHEDVKPKMPRLVDLAKFDTSFKSASVIPDEVFGVFERTVRADNAVMNQNMDEPDPESAAFTEWGTITKEYCYRTSEIDSTEIHYMHITGTYSDIVGEIRVTDKYVSRKEFNRMIAGRKGWYIHKRDKDEVIARKSADRGDKFIDMRFREGKGIEIVMPCNYDGMRDLFRLNRSENLCWVGALENMKSDSITRLKASQSTYFAVYHLHDVMYYGKRNLIGNSILKSFSEHKGYCQMVVAKAPNGRDSCSHEDIPHIDELLGSTKSKTGAKVTRIPDGLHITSKNLNATIQNLGTGQNNSMSLLIEGVAPPKIMELLMYWFGRIPLYRCFKYDGDITEKLQKNRWKIHAGNFNTLVRNGMYAHIVYDYVIFATFIEVFDADDIGYSLDMRSRINRIDKLEKEYKSAR